jgi:hypothetical protein
MENITNAMQNMGMTNQVLNRAPTPRPKHDTNKKQVP